MEKVKVKTKGKPKILYRTSKGQIRKKKKMKKKEGGSSFVTTSASPLPVPFIRLLEQIEGAVGHRIGYMSRMRKERER